MDGHGDELLTPTMLKAARALLKMDQEALSKAAGVSRKTVGLIEISKTGPVDPRRREVLSTLRRVLEEEYGVVFTFASDKTGEGVRLLARRNV